MKKNTLIGIIVALVVIACFFFQWKNVIAQDIMPLKVEHPTGTSSLIRYYAKRYRVSEAQLRNTIKCESGFNAKAVGDNGHSFGLAQINLPAWPAISKAQAFTPQFAIKFMATQFSLGNHRLWTCWRILYA